MRCNLRNAGIQNRPTYGQSYTTYGFSGKSQYSPIVGFAGQWFDTISGLYPLGNGRRLYSPSICRFTRPDFLSPFGGGGINAYAYCSGDPMNYVDPSGSSRNTSRGHVNPQRSLDINILQKEGFPSSLHPQLSHFRKVAKGIHRGPMEKDVVVARLYKHEPPHYAYTQWDLKYNFATDGFAADFVAGSPIFHLPVGHYEAKLNIFVLGVGPFKPARGLGNSKSYEVRKRDLKGFSLPAAQHERPQLAGAAWPEVAKAMWDVRFQREIDRFDEMLERYGPPKAPPSPPPRRR